MTSQTQATLLERLRDGADPLAWEDFFHRYWRLIYCFARKRGCREHSAEEIVQEAMLAVFQQRDLFRYDPARDRFRDWLATVVRNLVAERRHLVPGELAFVQGGSLVSDQGQLPYSPDHGKLPQVPDLDLIRSIGRGGFGEVWLAVNRTTGRLRAVKLIPLGGRGHADPAGRQIVSLTHLEAQRTAQHPGLLSIYHVGKTDEHLFYIMDAGDDRSGSAASREPAYRPATLASRLEAGPLSAAECLGFARQLLAGLAHLHAAGMVHRDVKPANCLFVEGQLKLADFGLLTPASPYVSRVGTLKYMPPDGQSDARADVYAAGLVLYEMLTGLPPESFPSLGAESRKVAESPALRQLNRVVLRACQRDPSLRFSDASEMLAALDAEPGVAARPRPLRWNLLLGAIVLLGLLAGAIGLWPRRPPLADVNFITEPFEATVSVDGRLLVDPEGNPYRTPCTVDDLPAQSARVVFGHEGLSDLDAGEVDFSRVREVTARWPVPP